ncbi:hypothetical protein [Pseudomonas maumuensis]|uniref:Uncharacterized protein n=1 Tax=Pseudomonas maumuensis TaxID=2842354 RepID=A0ABX8NRC8_9PSED|nr:hypothetical protein KSS90_10665 [Pseudomonas maumuensis]
MAESFLAWGYRIYGLSTQSSTYQQELVARLQLTFPMLSDEHLAPQPQTPLPTARSPRAPAPCGASPGE